MAVFCPQCNEIHFETPSGEKPTHCRRCQADMNSLPQVRTDLPDEAEPPKKPRTKFGLTRLLVGLGLLVVGGVGVVVGVIQFTSAKEATATVVPFANVPKTIPGKKGEPPQPVKKKVHRDLSSAVYTVNGAAYPIYPGVRQQKATFKVYYPPDDPAEANELRPMLVLSLGVVAVLIGGVLTVTGLFRFSVARARESDFRTIMGQ